MSLQTIYIIIFEIKIDQIIRITYSDFKFIKSYIKAIIFITASKFN